MPICKKSQYLNQLCSNTVYIGKSNSTNSCADSFCAELGSQMRPVDNLHEAFLVIEKRYSKETPVTISFSAGNYVETSSDSTIVPQNVTGLICLQGIVKLQTNLIVKNLEHLEIQNINLFEFLNVQDFLQLN